MIQAIRKRLIGRLEDVINRSMEETGGEFVQVLVDGVWLTILYRAHLELVRGSDVRMGDSIKVGEIWQIVLSIRTGGPTVRSQDHPLLNNSDPERIFFLFDCGPELETSPKASFYRKPVPEYRERGKVQGYKEFGPDQ